MPYSATVAIVGVGGIFPDAPDLDRFWDNIRHGRCAAGEVPAGRWLVPPDDAFAPEIGREDRVYSRRGCFIDTIPPLSALTGLALDTALLADLDPLFHLLLHAGKRAFDDGVTTHLDRRRIGTIIGNLVLPSEKSSLLTRQWLGRTFEEQLLGRPLDRSTTNPLNSHVAGLPAGILAHALGLGGGSCTLDAACASSLYAIKLAMDELLAGRADAMLTGGVSRPDPLYTQMGFSQLRALSKRGICSPFDVAGDGLVVGEGAGLFLLKRTNDAMAHGDRIYGIIRGVGLANDVGGSLLAPMTDGQLRAMRAAYVRAGWDPRDVDLIECHATGTPVGDATEVASLRELWEKRQPEGNRCVIGSVKSNIGHLLTAAGAAALTKVLLAMKAGTLPPTAGFTSPQPGMGLEESPFRVLNESVPWSRRTPRTPRRAAVSAFGFGGINAHLLVEEWLEPGSIAGGQGAAYGHGFEQDRNPPPPLVRRGEGEAGIAPPLIAVVGMDAHFGPWQTLRSFQERVLGGDPSASPAGPARWWGANRSTWFREEGLAETPFEGFYLDEVAVSPDRFRIPPREMEEMLPQQLLMLKTAAGAMADAGLDREGNLDTGVFIGIALDLNSTNFSFRWGIPGRAAEWAKQLGFTPTNDELAQWSAELRDAAGPPLTANRTMGALGSIVASRIAREFRIGGPSFTLSSEESSGLRALETAVRLLQRGEINRALVGAADLAGDLRAVLGHQARHPFSASGSCLPFDERADGSIVGEGAAAVVLKRVEDAERDGDRIYAVIRGVGTSGGAAPATGADVYGLAAERAYADARVDPATVTYLEAHAAGQPVEDHAEARALKRIGAGDNRPPRSCAVSTITPEVGHCGAASGIASFVRCCLALYHEIIPPCRGVERPLAELSGESPLYLPRSPRYWLRNRDAGARRAGVSAFGVDGTCVHVVLEGWDTALHPEGPGRPAPLGSGVEALFAVTGETRPALSENLDRLRSLCSGDPHSEPAMLAREWYRIAGAGAEKPLALTMVARSRTELDALLGQAVLTLAAGGETLPPPALRDRLFCTAAPRGTEGKIAFVFPGSGNHYPGMGAELSARWPEIFRRQDRENLKLRSQFLPELFWNGAAAAEIDGNHRAVIFGQVATGCAVSDIVRSFGVEPGAVIGYSLGESAGLFALRAWKDRDRMLARMEESTLFTRDLAGECRAAAAAWGLREGSPVEWSMGVVEAAACEVRQALRTLSRVYLLIVNAPGECVIGGDAGEVRRLVAMLGCRFHPLHGVTTVHCEVAQPVARQYHDLHLFPTSSPTGVTFYSGAAGGAYDVTRESAANAVLAQAVEGIDFPAVIETAYASGVRIFLEMGPGNSCSRMIDRILADRPHLARSACYPGQDQVSVLLRMLAHLVAERVPVDLAPLFAEASPPPEIQATGQQVRVSSGGTSFSPPLPQFSPAPPVNSLPASAGASPPAADFSVRVPATDEIVRGFAAAHDAQITAHEAFLRFSAGIIRTMAEASARELALVEALGGDVPSPPVSPLPGENAPKPAGLPPAFGRDFCFEFARGSVGKMLGPEFAEVDSYPTRVRLPDEPLMLVDRIVTVEGEPRSMSHGRVVTEHDIHPGAWYLDGGRIPTCIAVEAGQADLFLSGYLGIDFLTRGLAVYRLLDAVVTFHRGLPGPGETVRYDIRIERFFRQGDTWLFRFFFEATVGGEPLLSMRDGCAGFFSAAELEAGKGIVRPARDLRPKRGTRPADWQELVPMAEESYDAARLARLRTGDLAGCFGPLFAGLDVSTPLTIPGGRMELVHRVMEILPRGGRYGEGFIRAEADIRPDDWFITCHFVDDRVMPGTLMYECCMHTLRIFLLRMGWVADERSAAWEPVPGVASGLRCRGQVLENTGVVTYEVSIRELGYRPEPYVICDALMYADGKPIVEITNMSARLAGTTQEGLLALWRGAAVTLPLTGRGDLNSPSRAGRTDLSAPSPPVGEGRGEGVTRKPALYTKEQILAYSNGNPSEGFGENYRVFDSERKIARLPGPPFQFMDRVTGVRGEPWQMVAGAMVESQYDIPADAWYFAADRQPRMPFSVLLEAALQPCGWLAAYVGSALTSPVDISFRNLGGTAVQHRPATPESGTLTCTATMKKVATSGGMIIQEFDFTVADRQGVLYEGETMFGFFSRDALANQVGIRDAAPYLPTAAEAGRSRSIPFPAGEPFPEKQLRMIDRIESYIPDGGPAGLGYLRGIKEVDPDEWFFKAHFHEDPVTPGSLGLESFLQLLKFAAVERWGWREGDILESVALECRHRWLYRGQVVPANSRVTVEAWPTAVDDRERTMTGAGYLSVDGKAIYQMNDFTVRLVRKHFS